MALLRIARADTQHENRAPVTLLLYKRHATYLSVSLITNPLDGDFLPAHICGGLLILRFKTRSQRDGAQYTPRPQQEEKTASKLQGKNPGDLKQCALKVAQKEDKTPLNIFAWDHDEGHAIIRENTQSKSIFFRRQTPGSGMEDW